MKRVFADTFYYLALLNPADAAHAAAIEYTQRFDGQMLTSDWIVTELADALCDRRTRDIAIGFIDDLYNDPDVKVVPIERATLQRAWDLYRRRKDKSWSLTDCTSFVLMRELRIAEALTGDNHFTQAGFKRLLR